MELLFLIFILVFIDTTMLLLKAKHYNDLSIVGSVLARVYLLYVVASFIQDQVVNDILLLAVLILFFSDILSNIVSDPRKQQERDCRNIILATKDLANKLATTLDHSLTPFFTVNLDNELEYANPAFLRLLANRPKEGETFTELLGTDCDLVSELRLTGKKECNIKTSSGYKKVLFIGNHTVNGHETITGSIYILN